MLDVISFPATQLLPSNEETPSRSDQCDSQAGYRLVRLQPNWRVESQTDRVSCFFAEISFETSVRRTRNTGGIEYFLSLLLGCSATCFQKRGLDSGGNRL